MVSNTRSRLNQTTTFFTIIRGPSVKDTFLINKRIRRKIPDYPRDVHNSGRMDVVLTLEGVK